MSCVCLILLPNKFIIYTAVDYLSILPYQDGQVFELISLHSKYLPQVRETNLTILNISLFWV